MNKYLLFSIPILLQSIISCNSRFLNGFTAVSDENTIEMLSGFEFYDSYPRINPGETSEYSICPPTISLIDGNYWVKNNSKYQIYRKKCLNTYEIEFKNLEEKYYVLYIPSTIKNKLNQYMNDNVSYTTKFDNNYDGIGLNEYGYIDGRYLRAAKDSQLINKCKWYLTTEIDSIKNIKENVGIIIKIQNGFINRNVSLDQSIDLNVQFMSRVVRRVKDFKDTYVNSTYLESLVTLENSLVGKEGKYLISGNIYENLPSFFSNPIYLGGSLKPIFFKIQENFVSLDTITKSLLRDNYPSLYEQYFNSEDKISVIDFEKCISDCYCLS